MHGFSRARLEEDKHATSFPLDLLGQSVYFESKGPQHNHLGILKIM
jgi:hypothetical protein